MTYLPITYQARVGHSKVRPVRDSLRTLQYLIEVIATYNPLKLYLLLCLVLGLLIMLTLIWWLIARQVLILVIAAVLVGFSFLLFGVGLLAYLNRP